MRSTNFLKRLEDIFVDIIFPKKCVRCQTSGSFVCDHCKKFLKHQTIQICPVCEKTVTLNGEQCKKCKKEIENDLDVLVSAGSYEDELLARLIHLYKYKFVQDLAQDLGLFLVESLQKLSIPTPDIIIPVPLHRRRLKWRGYNQSTELAKYISRDLLPGIQIPVCENTLIRTKNTTPQMKIRKHENRMLNIKDAFALGQKIDGARFRGKNILLVDDVCTTGATLFECARTLKKLQPKIICATVLARQNMR